MAIPKPANHISWTDGDAAKQVEPSAGKKLLGWVALERPPFEFMNHLFFRLDEWQEYFESVTDELVAGAPGFNAVVGSGPGTFADINAAVAAVSAGSNILVRTPQVPTVTQVVNKNDISIEFHPSATFAKGATLVKGLQLDAQRIRIREGRFLNFDEAGGEAIELTANAKNCFVQNNTFVNNTAEIDDGGSNNVLVHNIVEVA